MRVMCLLDLYFESDQEVITFCEQLVCLNKQIELLWKTDKDWGNYIQIQQTEMTSSVIQAIAQSIVYVFITYRLPKLIKRVIKEDFYYTNEDEIERILNLTNWIIEEGNNLKHVRINFKDLLLTMFSDLLIQSQTVHFDSVVNFRMNTFRRDLREIVGLAIDEFRQEEEHQAFIELLRKYIANKESKFDVIHVLQGPHFTFFKMNGKRFSKYDLKQMMKKEPLYIVGLHAEEFNLSPLIAMAPKKIKIYGDNPSEPKTLTIINVFQERVDFLPYHQFPFPYHIKND